MMACSSRIFSMKRLLRSIRRRFAPLSASISVRRFLSCMHFFLYAASTEGGRGAGAVSPFTVNGEVDTSVIQQFQSLIAKDVSTSTIE